jgi:hypothetical protein
MEIIPIVKNAMKKRDITQLKEKGIPDAIVKKLSEKDIFLIMLRNLMFGKNATNIVLLVITRGIKIEWLVFLVEVI